MAITSATYRAGEQISGTKYAVTLRLVTDDARGTFDQRFEVNGSTVIELRDALSREIARLNTEQSVKSTVAGIAVGTPIPVTAPSSTPLTAFQTWKDKANRLIRLKQLGLTNSTAVSEINTLTADVNNTYLTGYAAQF